MRGPRRGCPRALTSLAGESLLSLGLRSQEFLLVWLRADNDRVHVVTRHVARLADIADSTCRIWSIRRLLARESSLVVDIPWPIADSAVCAKRRRLLLLNHSVHGRRDSSLLVVALLEELLLLRRIILSRWRASSDVVGRRNDLTTMHSHVSLRNRYRIILRLRPLLHLLLLLLRRRWPLGCLLRAERPLALRLRLRLALRPLSWRRLLLLPRLLLRLLHPRAGLHNLELVLDRSRTRNLRRIALSLMLILCIRCMSLASHLLLSRWRAPALLRTIWALRHSGRDKLPRAHVLLLLLRRLTLYRHGLGLL